MSARSIILGIVATIFSAATAATARSQEGLPLAPVNYQHDFMPFETFDLKDMSIAPDPHEGFFFSFDKLSWAATGELNTVGNPDVVAFYPDIVRGVNPPRVFNGIQEAAPDATFGWGERYEFGYVVDHHGWAASVLDGPEITDTQIHGFLEGLIDDPNNQDVILVGTNAQSGNVVILFDAPPGALDGFLFLDNDGDGTVETPVDLDDDLVYDADDRITFLTSFDRVLVRNRTELDGVELMKSFRFKPSSSGSVVELSMGARYLRIHDNFRVDAQGGVLNDFNLGPDVTNPIDGGTTFWDTTIDNHIVGPQVALKWSKRRGRFTYGAGGRFTFGYNVQDHDQHGQIGTALQLSSIGQVPVPLPPPDPNQTTNIYAFPALLGNNAIRHGKQEQDFSPLVEFRTEVNYHLTQQFALKAGFNATFIDNIRRASQHVNYSLPIMGFRDSGTQEILFAGVSFGAEFNR